MIPDDDVVERRSFQSSVLISYKEAKENEEQIKEGCFPEETLHKACDQAGPTET